MISNILKQVSHSPCGLFQLILSQETEAFNPPSIGNAYTVLGNFCYFFYTMDFTQSSLLHKKRNSLNDRNDNKKVESKSPGMK